MNPLPTTQTCLRRWGTALFAVVSTAFSSLATAETVVWSDAFDDGGASSRWSVSAGTWQIGIPASGPNAAFSGLRCAGTNLAGDYARYADTRLERISSFAVPSTDQHPRLRFWHWFSTYNMADKGYVEVKVAGATSWVKLSADYGRTSGAWTYASLDLNAYAGQNVQIAFHFQDDGTDTGPINYTPTLSSGWYIDDVKVVTGLPALPNPEGFESGIGDWSVDSGTWQVGVPTSGPPAVASNRAFAGTNCLATVLDGNYPRYSNSRAISPTFLVPASDQEPRLRFWHWFSTYSMADKGYVEVKVSGTTDWVKISTDYGRTSGAWTYASLDLNAYSGQNIQIAFHFQDDGTDTGPINYTPTLSSGWYIDDVKVVTGLPALPNPEGFESGIGDWSVDSGTWQVGVPTSGPNAAFAGTSCLATILGGNYPRYANSRAISPDFVVPAADQNPRLRFWHWFSMWNSYDKGYVEVKVSGTNTWEQLSTNFTNTSGGWTYASLDLMAYAGQSIEIAFHFQDDGGDTGPINYTPTLSSGWYIDNIEITSDTLVAIPSVYGHPEDTPLNFTAQATGANLILSLAPGAPAGATIHPTTGAFSWTPSEQQGPGVYDITVLVSQTANNLTPLARSTFTVQVVETNAAPVLNPIGPQTVNEGSPLAFTATATDPDNNNIANPTILASANFDDLTFGTWTAYSAASNRNWETEDFNGQYAWIFGLGGDVASDDWLISPSLKLDAATLNTLRFQSQREYAGPNLAVLVSTNYNGTGNPTAATWTALAPVLPNADSSSDWTDSGVLDLAAFTGPQVYVAFRYTTTGTTTGNARLWRVDDIEIRGPAAIPPPQTLTYSLGAGAPAGASINPTTGQFTWTPTAGQAPGVYSVTIIVTDNGTTPPNQSDSETIQITVQSTGNAAPVLALIPAQTVNEGAALNFTATATDANLPPLVLTFSLTGAPSGASIHPTTGVFSWTPTEAQGGLPAPVEFTVQVSDGELTDEQLVSVTVNEINQAPVLAAIPSTPASSGATISFVATAADADLPANTLAFSLGAGAPAGATIHPTTGLFTWTTPLVRTNLGTTIKIIVTDNGSPALQDDQDVSFTIAGGNDLSFWQRDKFGDEVDNPAKQATVWGDNADPDHDGTGNLLEFMMARNPMVADENLGPKFRIENGKAIMTYRETKLTDHGVYLFGNWSPDLGMWLYAGLEYVTVADQGDNNLMEIRMPINGQKRLFQRLEVFRAY